MPLMLSVVAASVTLAAPVRFDRVDLLSEDAGTFLHYDMPLAGAYTPEVALSFLQQVKVVAALPVGLYAGVSYASQSLSYEGMLWRSQEGRGLVWTTSLHTRLLLPYGAHAGLAWRVGPLRVGGGASLSTAATWARPDWKQWRVLPVLAVGIGANVAPGM
ncbi:hypothetical protein [Archangium primigenium]|uniref:hypothetical protein n=1 Tax=[Archangium] primigenium TaxID=2792470 RepID=UPI00195E422A|nr:hypothetical protein [Archangium primigenium]MBM7117933.1 hypothetical protein [Archangium primigenium]